MRKPLLIFFFMITSCNSQPSVAAPLDYPKERMIEWDSCLEIPLNDYYIYFFSESCGHCNNFKEIFLTYFYTSNKEIFFVNTEAKSVVKNNQNSIFGINKIEDLYIPGTPSLYEIEYSTVTHYYIGVSSIQIFIENN